MPSTTAEPRTDLPAISVRAVGKRYDIYRRNIDRLKHLVTRREYARPFWALREVSFDVMPGQAVGVIGRNGSGKSTLMQIIAGTLTPTEGEVQIRGRVAALLELGSGFNPQFTGRENVFLAGAILGISRKEMERRFDDIAGFADIGEFLDQPIEVYSSGMHARLAFSVAISVEPDILIVDEILSVGDAGFQQRCVARLRRMLESGVTLLLVSHSADAIKSICSDALLLSRGRQEAFGPAVGVVDRYVAMLRTQTTERAVENAVAKGTALAQPAAALAPTPAPVQEPEAEPSPGPPAAHRYGTGHARIVSARALDAENRPLEVAKLGERVTIEAEIVANTGLDRVDALLVVRDRVGVDMFGTTFWDEARRTLTLASGQRAVIRFSFDANLAPGNHGVCLSITRRPDDRGGELATLDHLDACAAFKVLSAVPTGGRPVRGRFLLPIAVECQTGPVPATVL